MFSSRIVDATDPDLYIASTRPTCVELTVTESGPFYARSILFNLGRVYAQRSVEQLTRIKRVAVARGGIMFLTKPGPSMFLNGAEIGMNQIAVVGAGEVYTCRLSGATQWGAMTLADEDMDALCTTEAGGGTYRISGAAVITPPPAALAHLRSLHSYMDRLAETTPELLTDTELARSLEHSLVEGMRATLSTYAVENHPDTLSRSHSQLIAKRFCALVQAGADRQLNMSEISRKIGVSGRTLRLACQVQLGVSPRQYVMLRRMQAARRALQKADPEISRVTDVATELGFWELGRFSVNYRHMFGEMPSATLKRPSVAADPRLVASL